MKTKKNGIALLLKISVAAMLGVAVSFALGGELEDPPPPECEDDAIPMCLDDPVLNGWGCSSDCSELVEESCCRYDEWLCPGTPITWRTRHCNIIAKVDCRNIPGQSNSYDCRLPL